MTTIETEPVIQEVTTPVAIIGRDDDFLYVAPTTEAAVWYVVAYLGGMDPGHEVPNQMGRLTLDRLEFLDGQGRRLELVVDGDGMPQDLRILDEEADLKRRIGVVHAKAIERLAEWPEGTARPGPQPVLPSGELDLVTYLKTIMEDPAFEFERGPNCSWLLKMLGWCG
jgi:hypothetical protein